MATISNDYAVLSRPVRVHWEGWDSDTYTLQRCGWQIATNFRPDTMEYVLCMYHKDVNMYVLTDECRIPFYDHVRDDLRMTATEARHQEEMLRHRIFYVNNVGVKGEIRSHRSHEMNFQLIDATPHRVPIDDLKVQQLEDMCIFKRHAVPEKQVIVDKADMTVVDHLNAIKKLQSPRQDEIRERMKRDDYVRDVEVEVTNVIQLPFGAA